MTMRFSDLILLAFIVLALPFVGFYLGVAVGYHLLRHPVEPGCGE